LNKPIEAKHIRNEWGLFCVHAGLFVSNEDGYMFIVFKVLAL